jgi:hypothetical protein
MKNLLFALGVSVLIVSPAGAEEPRLSFTETDGQFAIKVDDHSIASYVYTDKEILRPYFAHVKTLAGVQVTRNHPPQSGDRDDHATMHPGIWLAFGDLGGTDFWRNRAQVEHVKFIQPPAAERNVGSFIEQKRYVRPDGSVVCDEEFRVAIRAKDGTYTFYLESHFSADNEFYFGDQEEMGLGIRVATPISEIGGGTLTDSRGRKGAQEIWSNSAAWCDYSGHVDRQHVGMTIMCHPTNFRESWFHARDYGLVAANPFGRAAMRKGETSRVVVKPGETHVLRYAVWIHGRVDAEAIASVYNEYAKLGQ